MNSHETYTAVMRHFWQCQREHSFQPSEIAVYVHLVETCFTLEWKNPFKHANGYLCGVLSISEKTLISARNRLQQAGLVGFQSGKHRRDLSTYTLLYLEKDAAKAVNISALLAETLQPYGQERSSLSGTNTPDNGRDRISLPSEKILSPENPAPDAKADAKPAEPDFPFADFWQAYGKKEDKHKCSQRWQALSPAERRAAMAHVPAYVAATPEKRFRKNPLTYLNGRCWLDEDTPTARLAAPPSPASPTTPVDPNALFGYAQSAAEGLAKSRQDPDYQRYLAEEAAERAAKAQEAGLQTAA
jgi:hypothetical protein